MSKLLDNGLVALALIASILYALLALGPKSWRRRLRLALARLAAIAHLPGVVRRLEGDATTVQGACGECGSCEPGPSAGQNPGAGAQAEIRVPLEKIGGRRG